MPDVLTITRHAIRNYGSVLQAFATQSLIASAGGRCTTIDYRQAAVTDTARGYRPRTGGAAGFVKDLAYRALREREARNRGAVFEEFLKENLRLTSACFGDFEALRSATWRSDDFYCVGSDQVWNVNANIDNRPYLLSFAPEAARKFSFASSIGMEQLPHAEEAQLVEALSAFAGVSVREVGARDYLQSLGVDAQWHLDPTLVLSREEWEEFGSPAPARRDPYVAVYQLNANPDLELAARMIGRELGLPVVRIEYWRTFRGRGSYVEMRPDVRRFVALLRDAEVLISDSFHGAAFAMNLDTKLVSMQPPKYGGRLDSLLNQFGLTERRAKTPDEAVAIARAGGGNPDTSAQLASARESAFAYLARMTGGHVATATQPEDSE